VFTGLVEGKGVLARRDPRGPGARLTIRCDLAASAPLVMGESIAVSGACLSVDAILPDGFEADATAETLARTTLGALPVGGAVNLERSMKMGDRLGGHMVAGHVDGVGEVVARSPLGDAVSLAFTFPKGLARFIAEKGSVVVDGVSLTVNQVKDDRFDVVIIPQTREKTSLDALAVGDRVNLEVDLVARYVVRSLDVVLAGSDPNQTWLERLRRAGYM
jgi:riboflavin synthase